MLERLQADDATRSIPVLVLTGAVLSAAQQEELRRRAVSLLRKSDYSADELTRLVDQLVRPERTRPR
jgi:CheY-like chemotaxis protein